jgi:hypothetical protein
MPEIESCVCACLRVPLQLFNPTDTDGHQITLTQSQASPEPTLTLIIRPDSHANHPTRENQSYILHPTENNASQSHPLIPIPSNPTQPILPTSSHPHPHTHTLKIVLYLDEIYSEKKANRTLVTRNSNQQLRM